MAPEIREKIQNIVEMALQLNGSSTTRNLTKNKPTIFFEYSGHCAMFMVSIFNNGWEGIKPYNSPSKTWWLYLDVDSKHNIITDLEEIENKLTELTDKWR